MIKSVFKVMLLAGVLTTTGAFAQDNNALRQKRDPQKMFEKLDTDKDGKISMAEAENAPKGKLKENFAAIDTNKDNYLDKEELMAYRKERMEQRKVKKQK